MTNDYIVFQVLSFTAWETREAGQPIWFAAILDLL